MGANILTFKELKKEQYLGAAKPFQLITTFGNVFQGIFNVYIRLDALLKFL